VKFVVTGGAGFIGSHLAKYLVKNNHQVIIIDNLVRGSLANIDEIEDEVEFHKVDISNFDEIDSVIDKPDGIFHSHTKFLSYFNDEFFNFRNFCLQKSK